MPTVTKWIFALLLILIVEGAPACRWLFLEYQVTIENSSGFPMQNARLRIRGQEAMIDKLSPSERRSVRLRPSGETGLTLEFTDPGGRVCQQDLDVYMDHNLGGYIDVFVLGCNSVKVKTRTR